MWTGQPGRVDITPRGGGDKDSPRHPTRFRELADPHLTLTHEWLKVFTAIYVLTGIGILVGLARESASGT